MVLKTVKVPKEMEPLFAKAEEAVSAYFGQQKREPEKGTIEIFGERYVLVRAAALSVEFFGLVESILGEHSKEEARDFALNILFDLSHSIGRSDAKNFHNKMNLLDPIERLSAGPIHFSHSGWAYVDIFPESRPTPDEDYYLIYDHPFSFESDAWKRSGRKVDFPVCIMNAGYSSGWCEESFGVNLVASEILCKAKGDDCCRFIMAPPHRIEGHIEQYSVANPKLARRIAPYEVHNFFKRQQEAEQRVKFLSSLVEQTSEGIASCDLDDRIRYVNRAFAEMHGYSPEELIGKHISIFHAPDQMDAVERSKKQISETGDFFGELWHKKRDGTLFPTHMHNSLLRDEKGNPIGMIGTIHDITDRKQAEDALRESEEKFRLTFENAKDAILWADPASGKIVNCNRAAEALFERNRDEIIGLAHKELHPADKADHYIEMFKRHLERRGAADEEAEIITAKGKLVPVSITASLTKVGRAEIIQGIFRDITERKRAEAQLKNYSENLEHMVEERTRELDKTRAGLFHSAKLAAMGRMGAGIAHQMNTPICSGLLFLDSLSEDFENEPERLRILENLRRSLLSMKDVIDAMLSIAMMPQRGRSVRDMVDVNVVLKRVLGLAEVECQKRKVNISSSFDPDVPPLEATIGELDQVFINIINNAIDAMDEGGTLKVHTAHVPGGLEVHIRDTGRGISPENIEQIFEPFFTTRMAEKGLGLGLSLVREIVDRYGGEIRVESAPGKGSTFTVHLPAGKAS